MLELKNISVIYNAGTPLEKIVFNNLNLSIEQDSFVAIIGSNGAGKSTLAKLISGEIFPTKGKIIVGQVDCTQYKVSQRSKFIARVFQDPNIGTAPNLTILENLIFASKRGENRGLNLNSYKKSKEFFIEKLKILNMGLENKLEQKVGLLSGGQRQALSLIMATLQPAQLLILDEHTAALDPKAADLIMELTHKVVIKNNLTALMITHNMEEIAYCTHLMRVTGGKIEQENLME